MYIDLLNRGGGVRFGPPLHPQGLRYRLENLHGDTLLHFEHFLIDNVSSQSVPSGPIKPPKFNQGFTSLNKDISRTVSRILKIRPHSRLQI